MTTYAPALTWEESHARQKAERQPEFDRLYAEAKAELEREQQGRATAEER